MKGKTLCNFCNKTISADTKAGIAHHQKVHPQVPEKCFQQFGDTWDETLTRLTGAYVSQYGELMEVRKQYDMTRKLLATETAIRNTLATKLNGIIMILESKKEC